MTSDQPELHRIGAGLIISFQARRLLPPIFKLSYDSIQNENNHFH